MNSIFSICFSIFPSVSRPKHFGWNHLLPVRGLTPYGPQFIHTNKSRITLCTSVNSAFKVDITFLPWILILFAWLFWQRWLPFSSTSDSETWFWTFHGLPPSLQTLHCSSLLLCNPPLLCLHCTFLLAKFCSCFSISSHPFFLSCFAFVNEWYFFTGNTLGQALHMCPSHPRYLCLWCCQYLI